MDSPLGVTRTAGPSWSSVALRYDVAFTMEHPSIHLFGWLQGGHNLLVGHTQQPMFFCWCADTCFTAAKRPGCQRPTAPPPPADTPSALIPGGAQPDHKQQTSVLSHVAATPGAQFDSSGSPSSADLKLLPRRLPSVSAVIGSPQRPLLGGIATVLAQHY
jgi:hypothetical protein